VIVLPFSSYPPLFGVERPPSTITGLAASSFFFFLEVKKKKPFFLEFFQHSLKTVFFFLSLTLLSPTSFFGKVPKASHGLLLSLFDHAFRPGSLSPGGTQMALGLPFFFSTAVSVILVVDPVNNAKFSFFFLIGTYPPPPPTFHQFCCPPMTCPPGGRGFSPFFRQILYYRFFFPPTY